jgi:hypothetical protein
MFTTVAEQPSAFPRADTEVDGYFIVEKLFKNQEHNYRNVLCKHKSWRDIPKKKMIP